MRGIYNDLLNCGIYYLYSNDASDEYFDIKSITSSEIKTFEFNNSICEVIIRFRKKSNIVKRLSNYSFNPLTFKFYNLKLNKIITLTRNNYYITNRGSHIECSFICFKEDYINQIIYGE